MWILFAITVFALFFFLILYSKIGTKNYNVFKAKVRIEHSAKSPL
jgi:hypothetical protein